MFCRLETGMPTILCKNETGYKIEKNDLFSKGEIFRVDSLRGL